MKRIFAVLTALSVLGCDTATSVGTVPPDLELGRLGERTAFEREAFERDETRGLVAAAPAPAPATPTPPGTEPSPDPLGAEPSPDATPQPQQPDPLEPTAAPKTDGEPSTSDAVAIGRPAMQPDAPLNDPGEPDRHQGARTGLFWTGIAFIAIGGAGTIAFAAAGEGTEDTLGKGYEDGTLTRMREQQLTDRGEIMNGLAIGSAALALVGAAFTAIAYGVDYTRCGKLAKRRRKPCRERRQ